MTAVRLIQRIGRLIPRGIRNWLRSPRATVSWIADDLRHRSGADRDVVLRPGSTVRCHPAAYRMAYAAHVNDPEQARELDAFIQACRPGMILFDLGAHFGLFSLAAAHFGGPGARAVAVDPSGFACRMVRAQASLNHAADRIAVVEAAIADRPGTREMVPVGVIAAGYFSAAGAAHGAAERQEVRAVTVDDLAREHTLWPTHLKVDVEGAEADALRGARAAVARNPAPVLFLELHNAMVRDRGGDPAETLRVIRDMGYRLYGLDNSSLTHQAVLERPLLRVIARRENS